MSDARQTYLREMKRTRGYVLDYHKVLVAEDLAFMQAVNQALAVSYTDARRLDRKTKELISIAVHTAIASGHDHIKAHMDVARREGASKEEVLQVLELLALPCGLPRFIQGLQAWMQAFPVERVEIDE
jgi:4-carboxymuconolactone decarboxylase